MDFHVSTPSGDRLVRITLPKAGRIGILASGGMDSSVLLAMMLMVRKQENSNLPFVALNVKRGFGTERFSRAMVTRMEEHLDMEIPFEHLDIADDVPHWQCLTNPVIPLLDRGVITTVYSADTSNPSAIEHAQAPNRTPVEDQFKFPRWRLPFLHCNKSHVVQLMHQLNLGFITKLSHTCFARDEYRCFSCFQCEERAWAFKSLNLVDDGEH